jgi:nitroreductase
MDAYRAIVTKRDTRGYATTPIADDVLYRILTAGRMAGSSKNTQPARLVVLRDRQRLVELAACGDFSTHLPTAAVAIAVVLEPNGGQLDAGRAAQNMMVAAWAEGITSCPTSMHRGEAARVVLGLPEGYAVAIVLPMGYPAEGASLHGGRSRLPLDEYVHWERW